jgi:hypothetical protein
LFIGWSCTKFSFFVQYGIQDGGYGMTWFNIGPYGKNVLKDIWEKNLNFVEDLPVNNGSLIHKCLAYQRRKQKTTPTNDKMTATVPTFPQQSFS